MNDLPADTAQLDLFESDEARSLLDRLLTDARLYTTGKDYKELLDFVVRLRNFAPFNALLHIQKPGLSYAASARDWKERFGRTVKEGARPLLIMWPFGPVALVYDVQNTDGRPLPRDVTSFNAAGAIDQGRISWSMDLMSKKNISSDMFDGGDGAAGYIRVVKRASGSKDKNTYRMLINRNHLPVVQLVTICHELGHLHLGHLGPDKALNIPHRASMSKAQMELEAESVAYVVCARIGVHSRSETYLAKYVTEKTTIDAVDVYQVMRATGQVEALLGLAAHTRFGGSDDAK
jgi:hypothetical protein